MDINEVTLVGKLARDPDLTTIGLRVQFLILELLIEESWEKDGKQNVQTETIHVYVKNDAQANFALGKCQAGDAVFVRGKLRTTRWHNNAGVYSERRIEAKWFELLDR